MEHRAPPPPAADGPLPAHWRGFAPRRLAALAARVLSVFVVLSISAVGLYRLAPPFATPLMAIRVGQGYGHEATWVSLGRMSPHLQRAVIAAEDASFCRHWGFDLDAIEAAWERNRRGGRLLGGSTISMQTAKNVFLWPDRSWPRKALEAWFTVLIEAGWSKDRILETYLNVVEWGPGIYGAEAASRHWFGIGADRLSPRQAALLAASLPAPLRHRPDAPTAYLMRRANLIGQRMGALGRGDLPPCLP